MTKQTMKPIQEVMHRMVIMLLLVDQIQIKRTRRKFIQLRINLISEKKQLNLRNKLIPKSMPQKCNLMRITNVLSPFIYVLGNQEMLPISHCISIQTKICHYHVHINLAQALNRSSHTICSYLIHRNTIKAQKEHLVADSKIQ